MSDERLGDKERAGASVPATEQVGAKAPIEAAAEQIRMVFEDSWAALVPESKHPGDIGRFDLLDQLSELAAEEAIDAYVATEPANATRPEGRSLPTTPPDLDRAAHSSAPGPLPHGAETAPAPVGPKAHKPEVGEDVSA